MLAIEEKLASLLKAGKEPSLDDLGGVECITSIAGELSTSLFIPEITRAITTAYETIPDRERASINDFLIQIIENVSDEFCAQELVDFIDYIEPPSDLEDRFYKSLLKVAKEEAKPAMTRAFALDGSLRLACKKPSRKHALFATLLEIEITEPPIFIKNTAKIVGVANSHWPTDDALSILKKFMTVDEAKSESAYELGMAHLQKGFEAQDKLSATDSFSNALLWFQESIKYAEQRLDAELYELCLSILADYSHGCLDTEKLTTIADRLQKTTYLYEKWIDDESLPSWLGARRTELANWVLLARSLEGLAESLEQPSWLDARVVIENQLLTTYTASRSYLQWKRAGGVEAIIKPHIEASLITKEGQLYHLRQWLAHVDRPEWKEVATELLTKVNDKLQEHDTNPTLATPCDHRGVAFLHDHKAPTPLREAFEKIVTLNIENASPAFENLFNACADALSTNPDYRHEQTRLLFLPVLTLTLKFLESRMDLTKGDYKLVTYLFQTNPLPKEDSLQEDYFGYMNSQLMGSSVEVSNVGGGRADVLFQYKGSRIVSELKKEEDNCSFDHLKKKYAAQGTEYQNTNARLGILLVLDLTPKDGEVGHITSLVKVVDIVRQGEASPRNLVIVKVPGRRKTPSQLSR